MSWKCRRCSWDMFAVVGPDGSKATCSTCSQYVDCAKCSNPECGDTKCLKCYNKALIGPKKPATGGAPLVSNQDEDL